MKLRRKKTHKTSDLDEIFLDARNTPGYHQESWEGVLEVPIKNRALFAVSVICIFVSVAFLFRIATLQVLRGNEFEARASRNHLRFAEKPAERGIIYDRFGVPLARNILENVATSTMSADDFEIVRRYPDGGFFHVLGFLKKDTNALLIGASGLELYYDADLKGENGKAIEEVDAVGNIIDSGEGEVGRPGFGIRTALSRELQNALARYIKESIEARGFTGGVGIISDVRSGEIVAYVSIPDFDSNVFNDPLSTARFQQIINDPRKPFFNRGISGLYVPGSIVKPAVAAGALNERTISPETEIVSTGALTLPNPYYPDKPSIFKDWKAHGAVDMRRALAVSSDVYFYEVGGGFQSQKGLGIQKLNEYFHLFGFDEPTGIDLPGEKFGPLPDPAKPRRDGRDWSIGDTYHTAIGQGDMAVTPIQMARYVATIASRGVVYRPHIATAVVDERGGVIRKISYEPIRSHILPDSIFTVIHEGMRQSALFGTAQGLGGLPIAIAAKTGTAELGKTGRVNSWSIGFFPYENPRLSFVVLMESGPVTNLVGATFIASQTIQWIADHRFLDTMDKTVEEEYGGVAKPF
jgi:penicillin-binding protein 2